MATLTAVPKTKVQGGGFLVSEQHPADIFTPEDSTEQHLMIGRTTDEFVTNEVLPHIEEQEEKQWPIVRDLLKKAGDLGLSGAEVPEAYGGLEMDKVTAAVIADRIAKYAGFCTTWGAHTGIGLLPLVYFGSEALKKKYLHRQATGELVGAYALSEATSGSDALNCRARAVLSPDGKHYILNGEKMWITNGGFADLFTVFAKVDGEKFTAFLVERNFPGFSNGAEEIKMGIRGSSTCPIILNDVHVPVENVLGEIGKGHIIAFNILNMGRFKLGAMCVGGARAALEYSVQYAKERKAFGKVIADFGLVREKIANMALNTYVGEAMVYRTVGMLDAMLAEVDKHSPTADKEMCKAIEEYAVECSILKVWGSEMVSYAVDETVQIYGGYGFVEEYPAARAYRDARINRIFEGTNEINRLVITGFLLKRAMSGKLPLMPAIKKIMDEVLGGSSDSDEIEGPLAEERKIVANAKKLGLFVAGAATQKYMAAIQDKQEVMGAIADMTIEGYAMESAVLRTQKILETKGEAAAALPLAMTRVFLMVSMTKLEAFARKVIADVAEGDMLRTQQAIVRRLAKHDMMNTIALRQQIAQATIDKGKYTLV